MLFWKRASASCYLPRRQPSSSKKSSSVKNILFNKYIFNVNSGDSEQESPWRIQFCLVAYFIVAATFQLFFTDYPRIFLGIAIVHQRL